MKFVIGGLLIFAAIVYLIWTSATANAQYFMTVDEVQSKGSTLVGRQLRVSGAVVGNSIQYDSKNLRLEFTVAHTRATKKKWMLRAGWLKCWDDAVIDPNRSRIKVVYTGVMPDLLKNEAAGYYDRAAGRRRRFLRGRTAAQMPHSL